MKNKGLLQLMGVLVVLLALLTSYDGGWRKTSAAIVPTAKTTPGGTTRGSTESVSVVSSDLSEITQLEDVIVVEKNNNPRHVNLGQLDFGARTNPDRFLNSEKIIQVKNSGDDILFFDLDLRGQGEFIIEEEDCGMALNPNETCDIKIQIKGGWRRNGVVRSDLWFISDDKDMVIQLVGSIDIQGNEFNGDLNDNGETVVIEITGAPSSTTLNI